MPIRFIPPTALAALCLLALLLRLALVALHPSIVHPDEIFQYTEQAHRLVYGTGIIPWEFQLGVRNWLIPGLLAGVMELTRLASEDPAVRAWAITTTVSLLGLLPVICGFVWGRRSAGLPGALLAGGLNAVWFECVYYSAHVLPDSFGAALLVAGLCLAETPRQGRVPRLAAGMLLALALGVRVQLAPAILVALIGASLGQWRARAPALAVGFALMMLAIGLLDALTLGTPFQSLWLYVWLNAARGVANYFGVQPWHFYIEAMLRNWGYSAAILAIASAAGALRRPLLAAVPLTILIAFSIVGHKDERFVYPALPFMLTLAGIGTADLLRRARLSGTVPAAIALAAWSALSFGLAQRGAFDRTMATGGGVLAIMARANLDPETCGLAVIPAGSLFISGGFTAMRNDIPLYGIFPNDTAARFRAFNAILAPEGPSLASTGFSKVGCWQNNWRGRPWETACLWTRPGPCDPTAATPLTRSELPPPLKPR